MTNEEIEIVARVLAKELRDPFSEPFHISHHERAARLAITALDQYREGKDQKRPYTREDYDAAPVDGWRHKP